MLKSKIPASPNIAAGINVMEVCKVLSAASVCWVIPSVVSFHPYKLRINPKMSGETAFATF